jgi:DNA polymerase-2
MPTLRGSERGSKKRYAGLTRGSDGATKLVIRGLEAVRTDWTLLAREAQRELLERVFNDRPWKDWVLSLRDEVASGRLDEKLVYRKRLHREAYKADGPHVKAARQLAASSNDEGDESLASEIEYLMTVRGPQPLGHRDAPIDVDHYLEKQLGPALDVVLSAFGTSWDRLAGRQLQLFE